MGKSTIQPAPGTLHKDRGHTCGLCLLSDEVESFSETAARNAFCFSKDYHALYISKGFLALLLLHMCAG